MKKQKNKTETKNTMTKTPSVFSLLTPYRNLAIWLVLLTLAANALTLIFPKLIAGAIDAFISGTFSYKIISIEFLALAGGIFTLTYIQSILQVYVSERVARDIRFDIIQKISRQGYRFIEEKNPSRLLTNITSDIDSIKMFVSQAIVALVSSGIIILGSAVILITINWRLALAVLTIVPIIAGTFFVIFRLVKELFKKSREVIDTLNKVINESIVGSVLIRVLNASRFEGEKFSTANEQARNVGLGILRLFSFMIPIVVFVSSMGMLIVMALGGYYVTEGSMTLGSFAAFNSYIAIFIFPIFVIGFMSNIIAQASASYTRIYEVLQSEDEVDIGTRKNALGGRIDIKNITHRYGDKVALKNVSFSIFPHTKTAIIGPTAAGKTELLNVMVGLTLPDEGQVHYDNYALTEYDRNSFYPQIGVVFQDSVLLNTTFRENIAFSNIVTDEALEKAIQTAELSSFIQSLPMGQETMVSERGTSLSGGQKQRLMLARALALNPKILFLDDFTARVDADTEQKILANIERNYPELTLVSVTQKIAPIESYDQIILLMEGELLVVGTHNTLLSTSPEYVQIYKSQHSTHSYEIPTK